MLEGFQHFIAFWPTFQGLTFVPFYGSNLQPYGLLKVIFTDSIWAIYSDLSRRVVTPKGSDCKGILPQMAKVYDRGWAHTQREKALKFRLRMYNKLPRFFGKSSFFTIIYGNIWDFCFQEPNIRKSKFSESVFRENFIFIET